MAKVESQGVAVGAKKRHGAQEPGMKPAAEHDVPIPYMQRTRDYYQALGFAALSLGALRRRPVHAAGASRWPSAAWR